MSENKVQFNLKNVHYALYDASAGTYDTPVAVPGAVSLSLDPAGESNTKYADGIAYYVSYANQGYSGSLEMVRFPDKMLEDIWGFTTGSTSKVQTENANAESQAFALLFQIDGDQSDEKYVFYNCKAARPGVSAETNEASKTPKDQSCDITASPRSDGKVRARTTADTPETTRNSWFTSVFVEA